jgi:hypothetical protein
MDVVRVAQDDDRAAVLLFAALVVADPAPDPHMPDTFGVDVREAG